jgi:diaminopimelate decarboxylase
MNNHGLHYENRCLCFSGVPLVDIVARYGTPCYVYSRLALQRQWQAFHESLSDVSHRICYAVKANSNLAVLQTLAKLGTGFDVVSSGELQRVCAAGGDANKTVFSGVGKTRQEILHALEAGIGCLNVESHAELLEIEQCALLRDQIAPIAIRVNPDIAVQTHPYITTGLNTNKFGVPIDQAYDLYRYAARSGYLNVQGIACHLGSQILNLDPLLDAVTQLLVVVDQLKKESIILSHINVGGGLGIPYQDEAAPRPEDYCQALRNRLLDHRNLMLIIEPGRSIVANAGILITRVTYLKKNQQKQFAVVDAGMNDLVRPTLYRAWHLIQEVTQRRELDSVCYDVVGPICESSDVLGHDRHLRIQSGDLLSIASCGAYGFSMSSNYNTRARAAEVMIDGDYTYLIRAREKIPQLFANEFLLPE